LPDGVHCLEADVLVRRAETRLVRTQDVLRRVRRLPEDAGGAHLELGVDAGHGIAQRLRDDVARTRVGGDERSRRIDAHLRLGIASSTATACSRETLGKSLAS